MVNKIAIPKLSDIAQVERTPTVIALWGICQQQQEHIAQQQEHILLLKEQIQKLRDEIAVLKGQKPKPKIKPSTLEKNKNGASASNEDHGKRLKTSKRSKTKELEIHETVSIAPQNIPEGSRFKGYEKYTVQDLIITPHNTVYKLERWVTPDGKTLRGKLPKEAGDGHFGPMLESYILYQHYHARVTQPLICEALLEFGIEISAGQINRIITEKKETFHREKAEILKVGLEISRYIHVDDTGARHDGKNGYCTHIGNHWFAWFESTSSKSRINFLQLMRCGHTDYALNDEALAYILLISRILLF